ncbi:hypothetical protein BS47DRAFT_1400191 [Hydnum rufescens UP504]|uniref:Uncharacterized protein n=1 Tax=Hydnum rufescens UP504 TaxID=1448309 RepID=A0A9P6DL91_9AGAM|nr:hypothetical protein BS47DRAFT_1400191 [Hydnum rufescens UP504]
MSAIKFPYPEGRYPCYEYPDDVFDLSHQFIERKGVWQSRFLPWSGGCEWIDGGVYSQRCPIRFPGLYRIRGRIQLRLHYDPTSHQLPTRRLFVWERSPIIDLGAQGFPIPTHLSLHVSHLFHHKSTPLEICQMFHV